MILLMRSDIPTWWKRLHESKSVSNYWFTRKVFDHVSRSTATIIISRHRERKLSELFCAELCTAVVHKVVYEHWCILFLNFGHCYCVYCFFDKCLILVLTGNAVMTLLTNIVFSDMLHTASSLSCINRIRVSNSVCCAVDSFVMDNFFFWG